MSVTSARGGGVAWQPSRLQAWLAAGAWRDMAVTASMFTLTLPLRYNVPDTQTNKETVNDISQLLPIGTWG